VLNYKEEDARGVFQSGNAVFMRNWNYAYALAAGEDSPVRGKLWRDHPALGPGGHVVTRHAGRLAPRRDEVLREPGRAAIELVRFLNNYENQKERAIVTSRPPTLNAVYEDPEVAAEQEFIPLWKPVVDNALPRPSAATLAQVQRGLRGVLDGGAQHHVRQWRRGRREPGPASKAS
jgi:trehalose/maltose transport system substrate-binding protein